MKSLESLGLKLNRKKTEPYFNQPCCKLQDSTCTIYQDRPTRCRLFVCQQLRRLADQEITEEEAANVIGQARALVHEMEELLEKAGNQEHKSPLLNRVIKVVQETDRLQAAAITCQMQALNDLLNRHFRLEVSELNL